MCFFYRDLNCTSTIYDTNFMNLNSLQNNLLPNFVCRIAGFPVEFVENLSSEKISQSLQELSEINKQTESERKRIFECIYKQISIETDKQKRNQLLKIKREVFNNNSNRKPIFQDFFINNGYQSNLNAFLDSQNEKVKKIEELKQEYFYFLTDSRHNFKKYLPDQDFQKGLLISSKKLFESQNLYYKVPVEYLNKHNEQIERGLLRYFTRMAMKATPFGSFCAIVPGNIIDNKPSNGNGKPFFFSKDPQIKTGIVLLNKNIFGILSQYIKSRQEIRKWLALELNPTVITENESLRYLTSLGGKEVFQRLQYNPAIEIIVDKLNANENVVFNELVEILSVCEEIDSSHEEVEQYLDKLIQIGFIHLKLNVPEQEVEWDSRLTKTLEKIDDEHANKIVLLLKSLREKVEDYKSADIKRRALIIKELSEVINETFSFLGLASNLIDDKPIIYEDSTSDTSAFLSVDRLNGSINDLSEFIRITNKLCYPRGQKATMRHFYNQFYKDKNIAPLLTFYEDFYREHFKEHLEKENKIRAGYKGDDVKGYSVNNPFNLKIINDIQTAQNKFANLVIDKWAQNLSADEIIINDSELKEVLMDVPDIKLSSNSLSVFVNPVLPSGEDDRIKLIVRNGSYMLGFGKYFSRFLYLFPEEEQKKIYRANNSLNRDSVAEICGDANFNANLHPQLVEWEIEYPTLESGLAESSFKTTDIVVIPDEEDENNLKLLHKPSGKFVMPVDLGFLNPMMRPPLYQLLSRFSFPSNFGLGIPQFPYKQEEKKNNLENPEKENQNDVGELRPEANNQNSNNGKNEKIIYRPRVVFNGTIILSRKTWIIPYSMFPALLNGESDFDYFLRVNQWRINNNIPEEVFVKISPLPRNKPIAEQNVVVQKQEAVNKENNEGDNNVIVEEKSEDKTLPEEGKKEDSKKAEPAKKPVKFSRDYYKPQYISFSSPLLVNLFGKLTVNLENFTVTLEERYPAAEQLPVYEDKKFAAELIFQINFSEKENGVINSTHE